ncbi:MAG: TonB-dependent receptor [Bryobacteraceae bacterium]|nr:TonB-dependent receptor [Bryobacteraceae bacterium]MDW8377968.1 TonB-dependent receptor [Bryobacterales bacterium]
MIFVFLILSLYMPRVWSQSQGRISGLVLDVRQASVPGAKVVAESQALGLQRTAQSDAEGRYAIPDLPIGKYTVTAEAPGFASQQAPEVTVTVGASVQVDFRLPVAGVSQSVEVRATASAIEPQEAAGTVLTNRSLLELPINGRDYARFTLLTPGAVARSAGISDLAFNGLHPAHNNFTIDGVDASRGDQPIVNSGFERGARLLTGSLDSMAEFRVQTSNYRAEYGRAAGSVITVATRSGTNEFHGSLFEFFRNSALDARNFFNTLPQPQDPFRYNNFGANLGGPIQKNRMFFFANYEGSRQRLGVRGTGTVPSAAMREQTLRTSPQLGFLLENFPLGTSPTANPLVDSYTRFQTSKLTEDTASLRIDRNFSPRNRLFARLNMNNSLVDGPLFAILPSALGVTDFQLVSSKSRNAALNWQRIFGSATVVDLTAGMQRTMTQGSSETPYPQVNIMGLTVVPGSRRFNLSNNTVFQWGGTVSQVRGAHTWKTGVTVWRTRVNSWTTGFTSVTFLSPQDFINNRVAQANLTSGTFGNGVRQTHLGAFLQDTWRVSPSLTLDLGLRYDVTTPNHDAQNRLQVFDQRTGQLAPPGAPWYAWDRDNFAPRLGLAWQPFRRFAIRTGYGLFFQQFAPGHGNNVALNTQPGNAQLVRQQIPDLSWPLTPFLSQGLTPPPVANGFHWDKPDLYTQQWNFTLLGELPAAFSLEIGYVGNRGINLRRNVNINWIDPAVGRRPLPQFSRVGIEFANATSNYHALQANVRRRWSQGLLMALAYTYGKAIDTVPDAAIGATEVQNPNCFACERGLGATDIRHNASVHGLWELPWARRSRLLGGWKLGGLMLARTGAALNVTQPVNTAGSDNLINQRPDRVLGVNPYRKNPTPELWLDPAAFLLAPRGRFGNSGRNPIHGPGFLQLDASAIKDIRLTERFVLQFRSEIFNVLNRPNFANPNTVVGTPNFGRIFNTFGRTIGSGTSRQIQLVLRLNW